MTAVTFDTLKLAQMLRDEVKFSPEQAEHAAVVLTETFSGWIGAQELATKRDLQEQSRTIKHDFDDLSNTTKRDLDEQSKELKAAMREMNLQIIIKLGSLIIGLGGILIGIKYFS